jgi:hypothetical protein
MIQKEDGNYKNYETINGQQSGIELIGGVDEHECDRHDWNEQ